MTTKIKRPFGDTPGDRLRLVRRELNLSREEIERRFGLSAETLKAWENGKVGLTEKGLKRCIHVFRELGILVSREWLFFGEGMDPRLGRGIEALFKHSDAASSGDPSDALPDDLEFLLKEVEFFKHSSANATVLLVTGEEMLPKYAPGDYVGGRFKGTDYLPQALGKDCIIITRSGDKYLRRIAGIHETGSEADGDLGQQVQLVCHNPLWGRTLEPVMLIDATMIEKIAPVVWHRRAEE